VLKTELPGGHANVGDQVTFSVSEDFNGPVAKGVQVTSSSIVPAGPPRGVKREYPQVIPMYGGYMPASYPAVPAVVAHGGEKGGAQWSAPAPQGQRSQTKAFATKDRCYFGKLKGFDEGKGWGHILCDAVKTMYGKDVFMLSGQVTTGTPISGALACFKVQMSQKGPQASDVHIMPDGAFGTDGMPGRQFSGQVKSFNNEKGWGFISGEEVFQAFGKDIFLNARELGGNAPTTGEQVTFTVEIDHDGQPQAKNASLGLGGSFSAIKRQKVA